MRTIFKFQPSSVLLAQDLPQRNTLWEKLQNSLEQAGGLLWLLALLVFAFPFHLSLVEGHLGDLPSALTGFDLYLTDPLIIGAGLYWLLSRYRAGSVGVGGSKLVWLGVGGFLLWGGLSVIWASNQSAALFGWIRLAEGSLLALLGAFYSRAYGAKWAAGALVLGGCMQSLIGLDQFIEGRAVSLINWPQVYVVGGPDASVVETGPEQYFLRAYGTFSHPNLLGGFLLVSFMAALWLAWKSPNLAGRIAWTGVALLNAAGLGLSFSRSAWLGLIVGTGCSFLLWLNQFRPMPKPRYKSKRAARQALRETQKLAATRPKLPGRVIWIALVALSGLGVALLLIPGVQSRLFGLNRPLEQRSVEERLEYAETALQFIGEAPLTGVGLNNFTVVQVRRQPRLEAIWPVHNVPLLVTAELGLVGGLLWLLLPLALALEGWHCFGQRKRWSMWSAALLALLIISQFDHYLWSLPQGQILFFGVLGLWLGQAAATVPTTRRVNYEKDLAGRNHNIN